MSVLANKLFCFVCLVGARLASPCPTSYRTCFPTETPCLTYQRQESTTWPDNMAVLFWYFVKRDASVRFCTLHKSSFTRYQNNTVMYNWSLCTTRLCLCAVHPFLPSYQYYLKLTYILTIHTDALQLLSMFPEHLLQMYISLSIYLHRKQSRIVRRSGKLC